eukprot:1029270-Rhodomonas_salina.1
MQRIPSGAAPLQVQDMHVLQKRARVQAHKENEGKDGAQQKMQDYEGRRQLQGLGATSPGSQDQ